MKIILASFWTEAYDELAEITWIGKMHYAKRHGYGTYSDHHRKGIDVMWDRPLQWANVLARFPGDWVLITGCDVMVTRPDIKLESFIDPSADMMCLVDHFFVFGDCLLIKSSQKTFDLLALIATQSHRQAKDWPNEQYALPSLLSGLSFAAYQVAVGEDYGTEAFYRRSEKLLSATGLKVKTLNYSTKFIGDDPRVMWPGQVPYFHAWTKEHLMLHMGGRSLGYRLRVMPCYMPDRGEPFFDAEPPKVAAPETQQTGKDFVL